MNVLFKQKGFFIVVIIVCLFRFFIFIDEARAASVCTGGQVCSGSTSINPPTGCEWVGGYCRGTGKTRITFNCGADCQVLVWSNYCDADCQLAGYGENYYLNCCVTPTCTSDCSGKVCGDDGCGGSCGTCASGVCNAGSCCTNVAPDKPLLSSPAEAVQVRKDVLTTLDWGDIASWGNACVSPSNRYEICISSNQAGCDLANYTSTGTTSNYGWTPSVGDNYVTWAVRANNGASTNESLARSVCVEGYNIANTAYVSNWSACNALTHKRTRTCTEDCGTDDCTGVPLEEDCMGAVRGTLFDASDLSSCPAFDPATGYLIGVDTTLTANNRTFGFADAVTSGGTHPWLPQSTVQTSSTGNYNLSVYAPTTYNYDFSSLSDIFVVSSGPKLTCTSASAVVPDNGGTCGTQPCSVVNNMSFGFNRFWGGWWQVVGASVHGENGVKSSIPNSLATEQSLILPDATTGNRRGVLSYGTLVTEMFGVNSAAKASASLWQVDSNYEGVIYDYAYFNQLLKKYPSTTWNGSSALIYDDGGKGYEIVKVAGPVTNFNYNPTGTEKIIFLIDGNVTVSSNLVTPAGAYMAVIASGDISFATNVTRADGWFLADNIYVRCIDADADLVCDKTDSQFLGNGSFVGWKGIYLSRDRGGATNITGPAEKFTYRLDLYTNAPEQMKNVTKTYKPYVP